MDTWIKLKMLNDCSCIQWHNKFKPNYIKIDNKHLIGSDNEVIFDLILNIIDPYMNGFWFIKSETLQPIEIKNPQDFFCEKCFRLFITSDQVSDITELFNIGAKALYEYLFKIKNPEIKFPFSDVG